MMMMMMMMMMMTDQLNLFVVAVHAASNAKDAR